MKPLTGPLRPAGSLFWWHYPVCHQFAPFITFLFNKLYFHKNYIFLTLLSTIFVHSCMRKIIRLQKMLYCSSHVLVPGDINVWVPVFFLSNHLNGYHLQTRADPDVLSRKQKGCLSNFCSRSFECTNIKWRLHWDQAFNRIRLSK